MVVVNSGRCAALYNVRARRGLAHKSPSGANFGLSLLRCVIRSQLKTRMGKFEIKRKSVGEGVYLCFCELLF